MSARFRERGNWINPEQAFWTPEQDALLGTARDADVAKRLGRSVSAVYSRRHVLKVAGFLVPVDRHRLQRLREAAGLSMVELARRAGVHTAKPHALESGRERSLARDALQRTAAVLGCEPGELTAKGREEPG